jgi:hypothetical protein
VLADRATHFSHLWTQFSEIEKNKFLIAMFFSSMNKEMSAQKVKDDQKRKAEKQQRMQENLVARKYD